jgi:hypothetical protein
VWWRAPFILRSVLVTLKGDDDTALRGIAWQLRGPWIVLRQVEMLRPNVPPVPMDGEVVIPRVNVAFLQVL